MNYLGGVTSSLLSTAFFLFLIISLGYFLGSIKIKGISLGTAGILVAALIFGVLFSYVPSFRIGEKEISLFNADIKSVYSFISSMGTAIFITAVGLTAGPKFFRSLNRKSLCSVVMGLIIIGTGSVIVIAIILLDKNVNSSLGVGIMTGAMTSTPGFSSARDMPSVDTDLLAAGYGIAYLFGILGKVLFMQLTPKIVHADMETERRNFIAAQSLDVPELTCKVRKLDAKGICPFAMTIVFGCVIGSIRIPGIDFSLGTSGGTLVAGLILGHFRHVGPVDFRISKETLDFFREFGLAMFLVGAGVPGGVNFISHVQPIYFLYGACITLIPMIVGFLAAKYLFRLSLLNSLASIAGGLTSTPALGALIGACGTDEVVSAYAATYPTALVCIVLAAKIIVSIF